jgi:anti-sigma regulatory factor (Ser/Thr protein kinase)
MPPPATAEAGAVPVRAAYQHTAWTAANGAPPRISDMAQTRDGWLWLGTADGLFRFDGLRFERYPLPPGQGLGRDRINNLYAAPNGDLYISFFAEGVAVLHPDGRVEDLPRQANPRNGIGAMALDGDGSLWVIGGDLRRLRGGRWELVSEAPEWRTSQGASLLVDQHGQLWAANDSGVWRIDRAGGKLVRVAEGAGELLFSPDGVLWQVGKGAPPRRLAGTGAAWPANYPHAFGHWAGGFDGEGQLWRLNCPQPACLGPDGALPGEDRLSGGQAHLMLHDREGDIWVATESGLDRFRRKRFQPSGLPGPGARYSLAADGAGRMWAADRETGTLWRLRPDAAPAVEGKLAFGVIAPGRDGALLTAHTRAIERRSLGGVERFPLPPGPGGAPVDHHVLGILDDGKVLWTATLETGLIGWRDGKWLGHGAFMLPPKIFQSAPAGPGQLWLATGDGELVFYDNDRSTRYDARAAGLAAAIFPGDPLTISGNAGFGALVDGRLRMLHGADPDALRNVSGMVVTADGDRWLNGAAGLVHVRAADWRRSIGDPGQLLRYELFGAADGYPGQAVLETRWKSAISPDGRNLWLAATGGVVRIDTGALRRNGVPPQATILSVSTDQRVYPARAGVVLPPGGNFRVQFTAPALHMPERIRFEYRLDGFDRGWQDAGTRRATSYTNIAPGDYVFRVRAINEDGVAGQDAAGVALRVEPTLTQTTWFKLACGAGALLLAVLLYCVRVRYITARLTERLQVRTAERERIARTLHDTFLQTVQGLVLRVDAIASALPPEAAARRQLENVLSDACHAIGEGRNQLQELRAGDGHVMEDLVIETVTRLRATHGWIAAELRVEGERRALHAAASEEIAEIVREALRNAFAHSGANQIRALVVYGAHRLTVRIADNGKGIAAAVLRGGREGHWGLAGMRERAARIGARLAVDSGRRTGTAVVLTVPAARAYAAPVQSEM